MTATLPATPDNDNPFQTMWDLGYHRLVPVTPPGVPVSEKSKFAARIRAGEDPRGKAPGIRHADGTWSGMNFVAMESQEQDLASWQRMGASVGVKTGHGLIAIDVDTTDKKAATVIYEMAQKHLGKASVRFGRHPKHLLLYRAPETTPYQKVSFSTETEDRAAVELLSEGRQFVAQGVHPKTNKPYKWPDGVPRIDSLVEVGTEALERFFHEVAQTLPRATFHSGATDRQAPDQETLQAPSYERLKELVEATPNTSAMFPSRESYIAMAYALKGAAPDGYEHEARDLFLDWCERWQDGDNDSDVALADWNRAKPPYRTGVRFLERHAVNLFFRPVERDGVDDMFPEPAQPQQPRSGFRLIRASDLKLTPPEYLIDDIIETGTLGVIFGAPSAWKSFGAVHMAACIATGTPFFGHGVQQGPVIYLAGEGQAGLARRAAAWEIGTGVSLKGAPLFFSNMTARMLDAAHTQEIAEAVDAIVKEHGVPKIVFVDTTAKAMVGGDENNTADMTRLLASAEAMQRRYPGCVIQLVHHTGVADPRRLRGSSALKGGVDTEFLMIKEDGVASFENLKMKDGPMAPTMYFAAEEIILGKTSKGKDFGSLTLRQVAEPVRVKKVTKTMQLGIDTFMDVVRTIGNDVTTGVPVEVWRSNFMSKHTADSAHAKRVAFTRTRKDLVDGGVLAVTDDVYRLIALPSGVTFASQDESWGGENEVFD